MSTQPLFEFVNSVRKTIAAAVEGWSAPLESERDLVEDGGDNDEGEPLHSSSQPFVITCTWSIEDFPTLCEHYGSRHALRSEIFLLPSAPVDVVLDKNAEHATVGPWNWCIEIYVPDKESREVDSTVSCLLKAVRTKEEALLEVWERTEMDFVLEAYWVRRPVWQGDKNSKEKEKERVDRSKAVEPVLLVRKMHEGIVFRSEAHLRGESIFFSLHELPVLNRDRETLDLTITVMMKYKATLLGQKCSEQHQAKLPIINKHKKSCFDPFDLSQCLDDPTFSDVTLTLLLPHGTHSIYAHRFILSSRCAHFATQMSSLSAFPLQTIFVEGPDLDLFLTLVHFIYAAKLPERALRSYDARRMGELRACGEQFGVFQLAEVITEVMVKNIGVWRWGDLCEYGRKWRDDTLGRAMADYAAARPGQGLGYPWTSLLGWL